jgi:hypothetical protein
MEFSFRWDDYGSHVTSNEKLSTTEEQARSQWAKQMLNFTP